jgi:LmbE family N-acetylglucosaminyl deacetylase
MNQDHIRRLSERIREAVEEGLEDVEELSEEEQTFGKPEALITHAVDVSDLLDVKRASMRAHASQIAEDSWFLAMDDDAFRVAFGTEWYIELGRERPEGAPFEDHLLPGSAVAG